MKQQGLLLLLDFFSLGFVRHGYAQIKYFSYLVLLEHNNGCAFFSLALFCPQLEFCDEACITRYLRARGNSVRRAAKMLRATLNWREKINIGNNHSDSVSFLWSEKYERYTLCFKNALEQMLSRGSFPCLQDT